LCQKELLLEFAIKSMLAQCGRAASILGCESVDKTNDRVSTDLMKATKERYSLQVHTCQTQYSINKNHSIISIEL
jgi:hypothetical protein